MSRYWPVLLSLFLLVFFLLLLILPLLLFLFFSSSFSLYLKPLHHHCTPPSKYHNPKCHHSDQREGWFSSLFTLPKAEAWQTGAVLRQRLAGRLRPVPAPLSGPPPPQCTPLLPQLTPVPHNICCLAPHPMLLHAACSSDIL